MTARSWMMPLALGLTLLAAQSRPSVRANGSRVAVPPEAVHVLDGDTAVIRGRPADTETVRVLGIDTAELFGAKGRHPMDQMPPMTAAGAEARGFARGAFAAAHKIELLRSTRLDRYRRTLGYFFLDDRNYSVLVIEARLSEETISHYGDNGLPHEAAEVLEAARRAHQGHQAASPGAAR
jgi:endonuclease YncB( thermonuclease family)